MLTLSRTGIRNLASSDVVYSRGLQYYKAGRVHNVAYSKSNHQYRMNVKGSFEYCVNITEFEDGSFEHACNCPSHVKEKGACKHVVAALLFLLKYQEKSTMEAPQNPEEKRAFQVLDYFCNQEELKAGGDIFHIMASITIPGMMRGEDSRAFLTIHAGSERLYKIQSLKRFLNSYMGGENIILGKEFRFIANESEFDKESMRLLDYLLEIREIQGMADTAIYSRLFNKDQLSLSRSMLLRLFQLLGESRFQLNLYQKTYESVMFVKGNPHIRYDLDVFEDSICLDYEQKEPIVPLTENGELLFYRDTVYQPDRRFLRNYVPFYNTLGGDKKPLVFRGENRQRFLEEILPKLHDTMEIQIPEELESRYLRLDLSANLYFDKYNSGIRAELRFVYGEHEFNCFDEPHVPGYIIVRQRERENELMRLLEQLEFEPHSSFYLLKDDGAIYRFLQEGLEQLSEHCTLYYSEDFRRIGIRSGGNFHVGLRVSTEIDLLEMDLDYGDIPREELRELFRSLQLRKKYYRLKDGSFLDLEDEKIRGMSQILDNLSVPVRTLSGDALKLSKSSAFYLEEALRDSGYVVEKDRNYEELIERILSPEKRAYEVPDGITAQLRPYQVIGFQWLKTLSDNDLGGILADDMGLGKTLQAICYIASELHSCGGKYLIVCPTSLVYNWLDEFENFMPGVRASVSVGTPAERQALLGNLEETDVVITSYPLIRRDIAHYSDILFEALFIDEAQFIKNATSMNAQSVKLLKAKHRFALTGTPIENALSELWSIFDFIMPNYLMSHSKFVNRYERQILKNDESVLEQLNRRIKPFVLRRMKKEVLKELPEKIEEKILTELTEEQKKVYLSYMSDLRREVYSEVDAVGIARSKIVILAALTRLRQICCHPSTFLDNYEGGSGKLELLMEVLSDAVANGHRVLVFSQFTTMLELIAQELDRHKFDYFTLEGATKIETRMDYVQRFNEGEKSIFLISLKAGGTGLNLTGADTVIHYDPWWNPAVEDQATDRVYRIGQKNKVHVIRLLTRGTIEEKIFKLQKRKKQLSELVIDSREVFVTHLTREELEELFS
ncbi:MAG: DEAD/DEAH box helicase [Lachnospiraceae bacterium]|nr:DEAD/DEAH box helicase [Lachnospiraceae bacterium]